MRALPLVIAVSSVIAAPIMVQAQEAQSACVQAEADAKSEVNGTIWLAAGFFFGLLGIGAAYVLEPSPPAVKLMGKDPQYVAMYTDCYKRAGRDVQVSNAVKGCVAGAILYTACVGGYYCCIAATIAGAASGAQ